MNKEQKTESRRQRTKSREHDREQRAGLKTLFLLFPICYFLFVMSGCIIDPRPPLIHDDDGLTPFPRAQIEGAAFFTNINNTELSGDNAGSISRNEDGSYTVRMRRRDRPLLPSAMYITGPFTFSDFYKIICSFPEDAAIKPYRVYAFASRGGTEETGAADLAINADYPTARDLRGGAWPTGFAQGGPIIMSNEGINTLAVDRRGRPYINVSLYLYFNTGSNMSDPNDFYEFTLHDVRGGNGITPESKVVRSEVYRGGDTNTANRFILEETIVDNVVVEPILAKFNHRYNSGTINTLTTSSLNIDLIVPAGNAGKEIEFQMRNVGLFSGDDNLLGRDMILAAKVLGGTSGSEQTDVVKEVILSVYSVTATVVEYDDMTGVRLVISGDEPFTDTDRFTCTIFLPDSYIGDE